MKNITRIPVQPDSLLIQASHLFDELCRRGTDAAFIVPDVFEATQINLALSIKDKRVFGANDKGARWMFGRAFATYVIADESLCAEAVHRELPGEGLFIHLLALRQATFPEAQIYSFTEAHKRVTTDTKG